MRGKPATIAVPDAPNTQASTPFVGGPANPESVFAGFGRRMAVISLALLALVGAVTWQVVSQGQTRVIEYQAIEVAEVAARLAASARSAYAQHVVEKLRSDGYGASADFMHNKGFAPLPAQFLKLVGQRASIESAGLYRYKPISKWNLEESQGISDDFQKWAWSQLEKQDQFDPKGPIEWKPVWRIEHLNGVRTLRYLRADPAVAQSCVECHNASEQRPEIVSRRLKTGVAPGKIWRVNQLLGAIEVNIPLDKVEAIAQDQMQFTIMIIGGVVVAGLIMIGFFVFVDIAQARSMARLLSWQASHDTLTELGNRHMFEQRIEDLVQRSRRDGSQHALLFIDIDQFKIVNDTCGHIAGDELLRQLAKMLRAQVRVGDTLARLGGDEFGVLLESCTSDYARKIAESLRQVVRDFRFTWDKRVFQIGVSIGLLGITRESESVSSLMSAADVACLAAKNAGRNRIHVLDPSDAELNRHRTEMEWATGIRRALEEGRMRLVVQDAIQLPERLHGKTYQEILLRMIDDQGNPVPTGTVIGAAERYNLMPVIDRWVLRSVCYLMSQNRLFSDPDHVIAVNLSGNSIADEDFLNYAREQITHFHVTPSHLCFEITETAAVGHLEKAGAFIRALKELGCRFALDDFGAGMSSFGYLKNLPVDYLKVDGAFVRDIEKDPINRAMVEAVAKIGRVIGIATVAEWVENEAILDHIRTIGIDYAQGYGISRPRALDTTGIPPAEKT